ncbi:hypothetical protein M758_5G114000 [Ceratodon purpureus]|nr:hypothetical protein M758_5G114000 [Ceratodon purpureus]
MAIGDANGDVSKLTRVQKLFVMRHGQRWDDANRDWIHEPGVRTWDPPLTDAGVEQARSAGVKMRGEGVLVTRIFVSPFLRCVQTAAGFIKGMYPEGSDMSNLKVSIEYGLSELMNNRAIWYPPADPRNVEVWTLPLDKLFSELPSGVVDVSVQPVFPKLPEWDETREDGRCRYVKTFYEVADRFPHENILCISHGEGIQVSFKDLKPDVVVNHVHYCAYTEAEREVFNATLESPLSTGSWKMLTELGQNSGLMFRERSANSPVRQNIENKNQHIGANMEAFPQVETVA